MFGKSYFSVYTVSDTVLSFINPNFWSLIDKSYQDNILVSKSSIFNFASPTEVIHIIPIVELSTCFAKKWNLDISFPDALFYSKNELCFITIDADLRAIFFKWSSNSGWNSVNSLEISDIQSITHLKTNSAGKLVIIQKKSPTTCQLSIWNSRNTPHSELLLKKEWTLDFKYQTTICVF